MVEILLIVKIITNKLTLKNEIQFKKGSNTKQIKTLSVSYNFFVEIFRSEFPLSVLKILPYLI